MIMHEGQKKDRGQETKIANNYSSSIPVLPGGNYIGNCRSSAYPIQASVFSFRVEIVALLY